LLKLYHYWSSVCAQKVRIVLAEKKLDWESVHLDLFEFEQHQAWYLELNGKAVVPTLDHDGHIVTESNIIREYLEDLYPEVQPRPDSSQSLSRMRKRMLISEEDPHDAIAVASFNIRRRPRVLAKYSIDEVRSKLAKLGKSDLAETMAKQLDSGMPKAQEDAVFARIEQVLDRMEAGLHPGPWLLGDTYSLADISLMSYINRVEVLGRPELIGRGFRLNIASWRDRVRALESFREMLAFKSPDRSDPVSR